VVLSVPKTNARIVLHLRHGISFLYKKLYKSNAVVSMK
jgi:hypothetical protein